MRVALYDHALLYARQREAIDSAIRRVLESGRLDWGPEVPAFESEFAAWLGVAHAVTANSGTAALKIALLALGIGPGDEVITVPNSDISSTSSIHHVGARAIWVDVRDDDGTMDPGALERAITPRTRAVLPVDLYGQPADMQAIAAIARRRGLVVVEDACLALGAAIGTRRIGRWADVTCFSFAATKHLGSLGSGGAAVTEDAALAERMRRLGGYGQSRARHFGPTASPVLRHEEEGLNERLDELQAAVLRVKLNGLDAGLAQRRAQAERYRQLLADAPLDLPAPRPGTFHAWRNFVVHLDDRDGVRGRLGESGIATNLPYAPPLHLQPVYARLGHRRGAFPVSERRADRLLGLPLGPHLDDDAIGLVATALRAAIARR
jgi:dTDP-4-amino-4,6-dideoxygalactose transaminase